MIKHHPETNLLEQFVEGSLPASLAIAVSAHIDMCPVCQKKIEAMTKMSSDSVFAQPAEEEVVFNFSLDDMIADITEDDFVEFPIQRDLPKEVLKGKVYELPRAMSSVQRSKWQSLGKISRSRLQVEEGPIHASLLHIDEEGSVPEHTHNGFELTLLLEGTFEDDNGTYHPGDFIWLDGRHNHHPKSEKGCLCYTVVSDSLQFTSGISKLLNPIGSLIY